MEVRGTVLMSCVAFLREQFGEPNVERFHVTLPDAVRTLVDGRMLAFSWYPFESLKVYLEGAHGHFKGHRYLLREMGRFSVDYQMNRFLRFILGNITVERAVSRVPVLWQRYYRPGKMAVVKNTAGHVQVVLREFPHDSVLFCERLCGWMQRLAEITGVLNSHVDHERCSAQGAEACIYDIRWSAGALIQGD